MPVKTFSRKGKAVLSPPSKSASATKQPSGGQQPAGDLLAGAEPEAFFADPSDPFYFAREAPEVHQAAPPRASARAAAGSPSSKAARAAAAGGKAQRSQGAAGAGKASGSAVPAPRQPKAAAAAGTGRGAAQPAQKQRPAAKPAASLLSQRNAASSQRQQKQKQAAEDGSPQQQQEAGRPSVRSQPAKPAPPAAAGEQRKAAAGGASTSPSKRKAAAAEPAPAAAAAVTARSGSGPSPSKRMKKAGGAEDPPAAAPAPAAPAAQPAAAAPPGGLQLGSLARLLNPAALRDQAAATTVVQAQALGEQQSITDDALWALDGLASGSDATARDSLAALVEICATRRGRLALRSGNLASDVLAAAGALRVQQDPVQALGLATLLLCFCQADADAALLGRQEVAAAAAQLLQLSSSLDVSAGGAAGTGNRGAAAAKLAAVLKERPYSQQLPAEERGSPLGVALVALSGVLNPHEGSLNAEPLKKALREAGALQGAAQVAADLAPALSDASPTIQTVRSLWRLHKALLLLENACFACPDNEACLLQAQVQTGVEPMVASVGLVSWLVQQLGLLSRQALITGIKKDCLRALLAVLMNLTQNNPGGCAAVVGAGALEPLAGLLAQMVRGGPKIKGVVASKDELAAWLDELIGCLALLINLVEHDASWRRQLREMELPAPGGAGRLALVPLLCALLGAVAPASAKAGTPTAAAAAGGSGLGRRLSLNSGEVTLDSLESVDDRGAASIVEAYGAILLGFLDSAAARQQAAALLPGRSLEPVVAAVERCLHFYVTAGAMTQSNVESLSALLAALQQPQAEGGEGGDGGDGGSTDAEPLSPVLG